MNEATSSYSGLSRKQMIWTIAGLQVTLLLAALDQTIVSTAMPRIIAELNGFERYAWVTTAYLLSSTATLPVFGRLSDMYGRKWLLLFGAVLFVIASALCGAAGHLPIPGDGMTQLIICRGLQGIAGGAIMSLVFTALGDLFSPAERGKYQGLFSAVWALASVLGPVVGGGLTDHFSWRWVFYVNLPVGVLATAVLYFAFPSQLRQHGAVRKHKLDWLGVITLIGWVVPLLLGLTWAPEQGLAAPAVWLSFVLSAVSFVVFVITELRVDEPIVPLSLFSNNVIGLSCLSGLMVGVSMFGAILFLPLFYQAVMGASASNSGYLMLPMMLMITIGSMFCGQLMARTGKYRWLALLGLALHGTGAYLLSTMTVTTPLMVSITYMVIAGIGLGLLMPVYTIAAQNAAEPRMIGVVTGVTQFFRSIGGTLGAAIFNSILLMRYGQYLDTHIPGETPDELRELLENPLKLYHGAEGGAAAHLPAGASDVLPIVKDALVLAIGNIFFDSAIVMLIAFCFNWFLKDVPLRKSPQNVPAAPADVEIV
jgi:EmrB/QacA subfamily drug resistance transporter